MRSTQLLVTVALLVAYGLAGADVPGRLEVLELFRGVSAPGLSLSFHAHGCWPSQDPGRLKGLLVQEDGLDPRALTDWRNEEDWLVAVRRLTFQHHGARDMRRYWLQNWRGNGERTVYVTWEHDGMRFYGRRDFHTDECLFLVLPQEAHDFDFSGSVESAQAVLNSFVGKRADLSLEPLKEPRSLLVNDDGETVRKEFTTAILFQKRYGDVLYLVYQPEVKVTPSLTILAWLCRKEVLICVQSPSFICASTPENPHPLHPLPKDVRDAEETD